MELIAHLSNVWQGDPRPFLVRGDQEISFAQVVETLDPALDIVKSGDVVALIGDFDPVSISRLLRLIDRKAIVMPLVSESGVEHDYFLAAGHADVVIDAHGARRCDRPEPHPLIEGLRAKDRPGLILFSTGSTGRPKAILHDITILLERFREPRPTFRTMAFLLFDHIGGINTLFHSLFNKGLVISSPQRSVSSVLETCGRFAVELLPTTPTFLRLLLISGAIPASFPRSIKVVTYGTERMDQATLSALASALPEVDFRQTFGMSELGILRVKSRARDSLFMQIGGEGVETRVIDRVLQIRSQSRMLGYLNAVSPFDPEGWYNTGDLIETEDNLIRIVGRHGDVINVGGLKFLPSEVEATALTYPGVAFAKATARANPVTGQHVEILVQATGPDRVSLSALDSHLRERLPGYMVPQRIRLGEVPVGHRFKRL